ncbi:hypothetical protein MBT84_19825 [Streptomyces sp. MBT84]|nr:hypothetical protein [Streptomyces sp. MBT84]
MLTIATARSYGQLDDTTAGDVARCWNAAYPIMRKLVTRKIDGDRRYITERRWETATGSPEVVFDVPAPPRPPSGAACTARKPCAAPSASSTGELTARAPGAPRASASPAPTGRSGTSSR